MGDAAHIALAGTGTYLLSRVSTCADPPNLSDRPIVSFIRVTVTLAFVVLRRATAEQESGCMGGERDRGRR